MRLPSIGPEECAYFGLTTTMGELDKEWGERRHLVQDALDRSGNLYDVDHVYHKVLDGEAQFFPCKRAIVVTELMCYPNANAVRIWLAAGDMQQVIAKVNGDIVNFGRAMGAHIQEFEGRLGWRDVAKDNGFKPVQMLWTRDTRS